MSIIGRGSTMPGLSSSQLDILSTSLWQAVRKTTPVSLAERIEINLAEPRQDHRVLKLACRRIAGAGKRHSARVFERERASPTFGYDWT